jgi:RNA polymerase sigma-70 factor (ECF subfamily)
LNLIKSEHTVDLINRCKNGDKPAQYRLYLAYADSMFAICKRLVANQADAEEILQDAFVKAYTNIKKLKDDRKFGGWLKTITINECVNFINNKKILFDELPANLSVEEEADNTEYEIDAETVMNAIAGLPEGSRVIFNLYLVEGCKHKEIARMLKISESTSKSQYQRAKQLLKQKLTTIINERQV